MRLTALSRHLPRPCLAAALSALLLVAPGLALAAPPDETPVADPMLQLLADKTLAGEASSRADGSAAADPGLLRKVQAQASAMVIGAMNFIGVRYQHGGTSSETGFDCSGFTRHVFEMSLGLVLPRSADEQAAAPGLLDIRREDLKPGDLVFFNTLRRTFSHVGIYIGEHRFIHAPRSGQSVRIEDMNFAYWAKRFTGARRAEPPAAPVLQVSTAASAVAASH